MMLPCTPDVPAVSQPSIDSSRLERQISARLTALRLSLGLSAATFDRISGFKAGTTRRLERGRARIYAHHLHRLSQATGINIDYFYEQESGPDAPAMPPRHLSEEQQLLRAYLNIKDPFLKRDVFELIESLASASHSSQNSGL